MSSIIVKRQLYQIGSFNTIVRTQGEIIVKFLSKGSYSCICSQKDVNYQFILFKAKCIIYANLRNIWRAQEWLVRWVGGECLLFNH